MGAYCFPMTVRERILAALATHRHADIPWSDWLAELPDQADEDDAYELLDDRACRYLAELSKVEEPSAAGPRSLRLRQAEAAVDDGLDAVDMLLYLHPVPRASQHSELRAQGIRAAA
jgi:hypothetical protein